MKTVDEVISECTCKKRVVICELYDKDDNLIARESNRCDVDECRRIGLVEGKEGYGTIHCDWTHAEIMAIRSLENIKPTPKPYRAIIYGHSFACSDCERELKFAGVQKIECEPDLKTVGLKEVNKVKDEDTMYHMEFHNVEEGLLNVEINVGKSLDVNHIQAAITNAVEDYVIKVRTNNTSYADIEGKIERKILYGEPLEEHLKSTLKADIKEAIKKHQYAPSKGNDDVCHICGHGPEEHENFIYDK